MKNQFSFLCLFALLFICASCSNVNDSKETADSLNKVKDTSDVPMVTGGIAVDEDDAKFATEAANGGMAEVEFARVALTKTTNTAIKDFANMMLNDHGKANEELKAIATDKNITLPTAIDDEHQKKLDKLNEKTGRDFDKEYADAMVNGHQKMLDLMKKESEKGHDPELRAFATKTIPVVQSHLDLIKKIRDGLK